MLATIIKDPLKLAGATFVLTVAISVLLTWWPIEPIQSHGSFGHLSPASPIVMKGQEVYYQEGCQYCHSQNMRPVDWEVARFADPAAYAGAGAAGYSPYVLADPMEYYFETPSMRGSQRLGPDLSRLAGDQALSAPGLKVMLDGKGAQRIWTHNYGHLFEQDLGEYDAIFLSWRIRMMMEARVPLSDPYQKSVFWVLEEQTRGDALVQYLLHLGREQKEYASSFHR